MKKPTNKERDTQLAWLTGQINNLNKLFGAYIDYRGQSADFQKHLIDLNEKIKKEAEDDTKTNS
tara:strand:- start:704 stop:895 length:192 start_codon:yes stop_codon:yes gene_type:complete